MIYDGLNLTETGAVVGFPVQKTLTQPGTLVALTGQVKWIPSNPVKITSIVVSLGTAGLSSVQVVVKKNGVTLETVTLLTGVNYLLVAADHTIATSDSITVDVVQPGSGSDLTVHLNGYTQ